MLARTFLLVPAVLAALQLAAWAQPGPDEAHHVGADDEPGWLMECDDEQVAGLQRAARGAYAPLFYNNDFGYLCDPCYDQWHLGERLKRLGGPGRTVLDVGGQYRLRYHAERNMRGAGLTGRDDDFLLRRLRLYVNAEIDPHIRLYGEVLDAASDFETFAPRPIEENRWELQNLFVDATLTAQGSDRLVARVGRQEMLYGQQRIVSPLDWANTRRTFEGARLLATRGSWQVDGFWTRPVVVDPRRFDAPDQDQQLYGMWASHSSPGAASLDLYWLGYHHDDVPLPTADRLRYQTFGARWQAERQAWHLLAQGAYQFGDFGDRSHSAGFFVLGLGRAFERLPGRPSVWGFYDWASGSNTIGNGYHHLFPLAHAYLGYMDFFGRSNIEDLSFRATVDLTSDVQLLAWWHILRLQNPNDVPYTVAMQPLAPVAGGDRYLGQELDLLLSWRVRPRATVLVGYSHFFTGDWFRTNPVASQGFTGDADFVYTQLEVNF